MSVLDVVEEYAFAFLTGCDPRSYEKDMVANEEDTYGLAFKDPAQQTCKRILVCTFLPVHGQMKLCKSCRWR